MRILCLAGALLVAAGIQGGVFAQSSQAAPPAKPTPPPVEDIGFAPVPSIEIVAPDLADTEVTDLLAMLNRLVSKQTDPAKWQVDASINFWRFQNRLERGRLSAAQSARVGAYFDTLIAARPADAAYLAHRKWMAQHLGIGKTAPDIVGKDFDGIEFTLNDLRGNVIVLVFTGEWCGPCRSEYPYQRLMLELYKGKPFALVGVNSDAKLDVAKQGKIDSRLASRSWWDGYGAESTKGPIATAWGVTGWPTIYILDQQGVIRFAGVRHEDTLKAVAQLMR